MFHVGVVQPKRVSLRNSNTAYLYNGVYSLKVGLGKKGNEFQLRNSLLVWKSSDALAKSCGRTQVLPITQHRHREYGRTRQRRAKWGRVASPHPENEDRIKTEKILGLTKKHGKEKREEKRSRLKRLYRSSG